MVSLPRSWRDTIGGLFDKAVLDSENLKFGTELLLKEAPSFLVSQAQQYLPGYEPHYAGKVRAEEI